MLYYLVAYALMNLGAFGVVVALGRQAEPNEEIADYAGLGFRKPALAAAMAIFMLSLTGVPPLVGFTGKFYIFSAAVEAGYVGLAVIGVLNSVVSAYYYIGVIVTMYMRDGSRPLGVFPARPYLTAAIAVGAVGTVLLGVFPAGSMGVALQSFRALG
jgi:NADH-quinone oxidoreductase subunit N